MTNKLLPLLELSSNNRVNRSSPDRASETKDQGFSKTLQETEKKLAANKADAQAARELRTERWESLAKNDSSTANESIPTASLDSVDDKKVDSQTSSDKANAEAVQTTSNTNKAREVGVIATGIEGNLKGDSDINLLVNGTAATNKSLLTSSELAAMTTLEIQSLLDGLTKQLESLSELESSSVMMDPAALQQLVDELFVDSSQLPLVAIAETVNEAMIDQPLTLARAAALMSDLKEFGALSSAAEHVSLKLSAALTPSAQLRSFFGVNVSGSVDVLESSPHKLSTDISPLQSLANVPLNLNAAGPKPQLAVGMPFQQAQWGEAVAERVMWMSSQGLQEAEIHLNPTDLGPMQVKVSVVADQAHVSFVVSNASVREALDQNAIRLREMFNGEGLNLVDVDVSDQSQHQASSSDDDRNNPQFSGERAELDLVQGENQLSIHSNGKGMLSLYA
jgi:flagellar hook-length control protein FliK